MWPVDHSFTSAHAPHPHCSAWPRGRLCSSTALPLPASLLPRIAVRQTSSLLDDPCSPGRRQRFCWPLCRPGATITTGSASGRSPLHSSPRSPGRSRTRHPGSSFPRALRVAIRSRGAPIINPVHTPIKQPVARASSCCSLLSSPAHANSHATCSGRARHGYPPQPAVGTSAVFRLFASSSRPSAAICPRRTGRQAVCCNHL